jgi:hypothetical protein
LNFSVSIAGMQPAFITIMGDAKTQVPYGDAPCIARAAGPLA